MTSLLLTLLVGIALISTLFLLLLRFTRLDSGQIGLLVGIVTLGAFVPYTIIQRTGIEIAALQLALFMLTPYLLTMLLRRREQKGAFAWPPALIVAFFLFIAAVDAVLITLAETGLGGSLASALLPEPRSSQGAHRSSFPGVVSHDFQEREQDFNDYIEQRRIQEQRGWRVRRGWLGEAIAGREATFQIQILDREELPIDGATAQGRFLRPADADFDVSFELEPTGDGYYRAPITLPHPGRWQLILIIERGDEQHEVRARTWIEPEAG